MSHSRLSTLKPSGPNHCVICFGSDQAWNTRSRGAAMTRLSTISRSSAQILRESAFMVVTFRFCRLRGLRYREKAFEAVGSALPGFSRLVRPPRPPPHAVPDQIGGPL